MKALPPLRRTIDVSWDQASAFRRFTEDFARWWPVKTHSIGGARVRAVVFEARVNGCIYEEHVDGRRFAWGKILEYQAPQRVKFLWHPSREPETAQTVEVRFHAQGTGTRVELIAWDWERWGKGAAAARRGYKLGWSYVLNVWAGRRTLGVRVVDGISAATHGLRKLRGKVGAEDIRAGGELPRA